MTPPEAFDRPGTTPAIRRRRPAFVRRSDEIEVPPLDEIAPALEPPWHKEGTDTPDRTVVYRHPDGHRIGLRLQARGLAIQAWITAGPDLPPISGGTAAECAEAQAANDARLQPGRTWHAVLITRTSNSLVADLAALVRERLLPALTNKPRGIPAPPPPARIGQPEITSQKKETQK
ncbi:hypothetical protein K7472_08175 [Streptomyces sp. PTM05]|uniref:Uncharacterized protein n=1 Tax=Streptantibioticus parmotrematis TaxID=2873249 RepID=A0ABS7QSL2_9ACTN|nr:hypothetical protein [Streptantibioticus parmotrematis]MBY8884822.1 hypothetical protein [Streptantibioticus parmotrematis]